MFALLILLTIARGYLMITTDDIQYDLFRLGLRDSSVRKDCSYISGFAVTLSFFFAAFFGFISLSAAVDRDLFQERVGTSSPNGDTSAHPYLAWERPVNERTNRLLRRFTPKGVSVHSYTDEQIIMFADKINLTSMKRLGCRTDEELFDEQHLIWETPVAAMCQ